MAAVPYPGPPGYSPNHQGTIDMLHDMFPGVDVNWLSDRVKSGIPRHMIIEQLLDPVQYQVPMTKGPSRRSSVQSRDSLETSQSEAVEFEINNDGLRCAETREEFELMVSLLSNEYRRLAIADIRELLQVCERNYLSAALTLKNYVELENFFYPKGGGSFMLEVNSPSDGIREVEMIINKTTRGKRVCHVPDEIPVWLKTQQKMVEKGQRAADVESNNKIECPICTDEVPLSHAKFCTLGHMFCKECVRNYIKENVYGQAKASLNCMQNQCEGEFQMADIRKLVGRETWKKLNERKDEEALLAINTENVERCPYCNYAVIMEITKEENKVFKCGRSRCQAEVCRICGKDWNEKHIGVKCEMLKENNEETKRKEFEEKMALSVIRHCHRCKLPLSKEGGCSKMKCSCGATLCYLCRTPDIDYNHFCSHARSPGKKCPLCTNCFLWEDADKTDRAMLRQIQNEANEQLPSTSHMSLVDKSPIKAAKPLPIGQRRVWDGRNWVIVGHVVPHGRPAQQNAAPQP